MNRVGALIYRRATDGFVRLCHGDLHLRNVVEIRGRPTIFDAIEFNEELAVIDVLYDLSFLLMDLDHCRMRPLANRVLNRYLEVTGDYAGLATLPLFLSTRAAVRAMVSASIAEAMSGDTDDRAQEQALFWELAGDYLTPSPSRLVAIGGVSGTGKSTAAQGLAPEIGPAPGAVILRSDALRKRQFGVDRFDRLPPDAYGQAVSHAVYGELVDAARTVLQGDHAVIADAVFAGPEERRDIANIAGGRRFDGFWLDAPDEILEARIAARIRDVSDADADVLAVQRRYGLGQIDWRRIDATAEPGAIAEAMRTVMDQPLASAAKGEAIDLM